MNGSISWSRGYPVRESYPASWHSFQSPAHLRVICALMGVAWEVGPDTPLAIAEVGCGTGYTAQMLAAGNPHWQVVGLDYNPAHIAEARSMATAADLNNLQFLESDLAELSDADLERLPEFDLITVHGVWSWVSDPVRQGVLRLLQRRLKAGGLALVSYNALPGAADGIGLARLIRTTLMANGGNSDGLAMAAKQVERLVTAEASHLPASLWRRLLTGDVKGARPGYLLHEFLTEHWRPSFHGDVGSALSTVRCEYVGSATIDENFPQLSLSSEQRELWDEAPDSAARELIFDLSVGRAFRRDLYVRGVRRVPRDAAVDALWVALATDKQGEVTLKTQAGEATLPQALMDAVRTRLRLGPATIGALRTLPDSGTVTPSELLAILVGSRCAVPLWRQPGTGADWAQSLAAARRFNRVASERLAPFGMGEGNLGLATPALGGGLPALPLDLAVAQQLLSGTVTNADGHVGEAGDVRDEAVSLVQRILPPDSAHDAHVIAELELAVAGILRERRPVWKALGIL